MVGVAGVTTLMYSGLGTGISANAFAKHHMETTILEIDPAVYDAARQYFGLPDPGSNNVFLQDARGWVGGRRAMVEAEDASTVKYDIVVHDCFSGGGVPEHLFSIEFWNDLKTILSSEGIVAVVRNFRHCIRPITHPDVLPNRILLENSHPTPHEQYWSLCCEPLGNVESSMTLLNPPLKNSFILILSTWCVCLLRTSGEEY